MTWKDEFRAALLKYVQDKLLCIDAVEVTDFEDHTVDRGYCETCSYTITIVEITYRDKQSYRLRQVEYEGSFSELITALTEGGS